ncbi:hypothetical protein KIH74_32440 [Kineosporia sp. J2-2]|uniref:Clp R domain-containing protein n=1 Tax=Kineosporia corallincola TaxID=2835133 RepID=A0ABS5TSC4_9ACTN|nr:Clp protease N-terminal domain-containing protein [Kineosporia corallincola]MBT0773699.1 hypothetical protein [Kineosporia corallincola]
MFERLADEARDTVVSALTEAGLRGDRRIGTEHLLLGVLHAPGPAAALATDVQAARHALDDLDRAALGVVGIDVEGIERLPSPASRKRAPFTSGARAVFPRALSQTRRSGSRRITPEHVALALLECARPDPAGELLDQLGVDRQAARTRLQRRP